MRASTSPCGVDHVTKRSPERRATRADGTSKPRRNARQVSATGTSHPSFVIERKTVENFVAIVAAGRPGTTRIDSSDGCPKFLRVSHMAAKKKTAKKATKSTKT